MKLGQVTKLDKKKHGKLVYTNTHTHTPSHMHTRTRTHTHTHIITLRNTFFEKKSTNGYFCSKV